MRFLFYYLILSIRGKRSFRRHEILLPKLALLGQEEKEEEEEGWIFASFFCGF